MKPSNAPVIFVVALAAAIRLFGLDYGQPFWLVNDELPLIAGALRMLELRNPIPSFNPGPMSILYYPPGLPWLYLVVWVPIVGFIWLFGGVASLNLLGDRLLSDLGPIWTAARLTSVVFSCATVWAVATLAESVSKSRTAGILAGLLLATSFHHAMLGHFARVWPATVCFFWFGLLAAWRVYEHGRRRDYLAAAAAAIFGFATNYIGVLVVGAVAMAHLCRHRNLKPYGAIVEHVLLVVAVSALFVLASWPNFLRLMGYSVLLSGFSPAPREGQIESWALLSFYFDVALRSDPLLFAVGAAGLAAIVWKQRLFVLLCVTTFLPYVVLLLTGLSNDDRYILPITPFFAVSAACLYAATRGNVRRIVLCLLVAVAAVQGAASLQFSALMAKDDTRVHARSWLVANIKEGDGVISILRGIQFEQDLESIRLEQKLAPSATTYLQRRRLEGAVLDSGGGGAPIPAVHLRQVAPSALTRWSADEIAQMLVAQGYRWIAVDDLSGPIGDGRLEAILLDRSSRVVTFAPGPQGVLGPIMNLTNQFEMGRWSDVFAMQRLGPEVRIFELR